MATAAIQTSAPDAREFSFTHTLSYDDWRGRERECEATIRYTFDGQDYHCTSAIAHSDDDEAEYALDEIADDLIADRCDADWEDV